MREKSEEIKIWLKEHPYFKVAPFCSTLGLDKGNFTKIINSKERDIPEKHIPKIEAELKKYGFQSKVQVNDLTKPTNVLKPHQQPKTNFSIDTIPEQKKAPTAAQALENAEIEKLIAEIKAEKIPELRNKSDLGRKSWKMEQEKRIQELKNQLK